jgi:hypothetical protein
VVAKQLVQNWWLPAQLVRYTCEKLALSNVLRTKHDKLLYFWTISAGSRYDSRCLLDDLGDHTLSAASRYWAVAG